MKTLGCREQDSVYSYACPPLSRRAFSLIELLAAVAIMAVLTVLLFPVLARAKERALDSQETSQLRQLAVAHGLYVADHDDLEPASSVPIVAEGYAPRTLVRSVLDPFEKGWANENRTGYPEGPVGYKDSFITLKMSAGEAFFSAFRQSQAGGWLIAAGPQLQRLKSDTMFQPVPYKRLTFGGGIVRRRFSVRSNASGGKSLLLDRCFSDDEVIPDIPSRLH